MDLKSLLELRKKAKSKKPTFIRQDYHKKRRLGKKWRKPKGLQSKLRLGKAGRHKKTSQGYRSPKKARKLHHSGLKTKLVHAEKDLEGVEPKEEAVVVATNVGKKKKITILKKAKEKNVKVLNVKDAEAFVKEVEEKLSFKRKKKEEAKKKETKEEKTKEEEKLSDKLSEEEKKEAEKKNKDKLLSKRER